MENASKLDIADLLQAKLFESELARMQSDARAKTLEFQAFLDAVWNKYGLVKGLDRFETDGTITRGERPAPAAVPAEAPEAK